MSPSAMAVDRSSFFRGISMFIVYAPVTRAIPSAVIAVAFGGQGEQPTGNQLFVSRDHMIRHGGNGALGVGVAAAEVAARAHEHVNDGLELFIAEAIDRAGVPRAPQDADIGGWKNFGMFFVGRWGKKIGFVWKVAEFLHLTDGIEESARPLQLP